MTFQPSVPEWSLVTLTSVSFINHFVPWHFTLKTTKLHLSTLPTWTGCQFLSDSQHFILSKRSHVIFILFLENRNWRQNVTFLHFSSTPKALNCPLHSHWDERAAQEWPAVVGAASLYRYWDFFVGQGSESLPWWCFWWHKSPLTFCLSPRIHTAHLCVPTCLAGVPQHQFWRQVIAHFLHGFLLLC